MTDRLYVLNAERARQEQRTGDSTAKPKRTKGKRAAPADAPGASPHQAQLFSDED